MDVIERIVPPLYVQSRSLIQVQVLSQANIALCNCLVGRSVLGVSYFLLFKKFLLIIYAFTKK